MMAQVNAELQLFVCVDIAVIMPKRTAAKSEACKPKAKAKTSANAKAASVPVEPAESEAIVTRGNQSGFITAMKYKVRAGTKDSAFAQVLLED